MASPTVDTKIWLALRARVETLLPWVLATGFWEDSGFWRTTDIDAPGLKEALPILWPGQNVDMPSGNALEVTHLVNKPNRRFIGSNDPHDRMGILQIALLSTFSGNAHAETVTRDVAGTIAEHFATDLRLSYADVMVRIYEAPEVGTSFKDEARSRVVTPVSVRWQCFA